MVRWLCFRRLSSTFALRPDHVHWITRTTERATVDCPHLSSIQLQLITPNCSLWTASSEEAAKYPFPDPFWAFCWPGSYGISRYLLEQRGSLTGKSVLDFGAGCGIGSIIALQQGAAQAIVNDIDTWSCSAAYLNLLVNLKKEPAAVMEPSNLVGTSIDHLLEMYSIPDASQLIVLAGDVCYEESLARQVIDWLHALAQAKVTVLIGDPGRQFLPHQRLTQVASYPLPPSLAKDNYGHAAGVVWTMDG